MIDATKPDADPRIHPCEHMVDKVSSFADGSLRGLARWYTRFHVITCPRCRKALEALRALRDRLLRLSRSFPTNITSLSDARKHELVRVMDRIDHPPRE